MMEMTEREWPRIGRWMSGQPIIGEVGLIEPPDRHPWCSYVVLPQSAVLPQLSTLVMFRWE